MTKVLSERRPLKTIRALKTVLVDLLQTRDLQNISIKEITDKAHISRGTFYLHFSDIFALYQAIETDVVESINGIINSKVPIQDEDELEKIIGSIFDYLTLHIKECDALLRTDSASFLSAVFESNRPNVMETWETLFGTDEHARAYSYIFLSHGFAGILKHWMTFGKIETPRQIAIIVKRLLGYMFLDTPQKQSDGGIENISGNQE
ncbi:MAG: TetR/AcrR family transcriptional regulator [Clostridiales bacterium]|jgi:AcrR family transcriptional regulator|nr:TetR/AcrR family transcriptional regulator [Clostridiales bacterium]